MSVTLCLAVTVVVGIHHNMGVLGLGFLSSLPL